MNFKRMLNNTQQPGDEEILDTIGSVGLWFDLRQYLQQNYDFHASEF